MLYAAIGAGAAVLLAVIIFYFYVFVKCYIRKDSPPLETLDLSNTHYAKYEDELLETLAKVKSMAYEPVRIKAFDGIDLGARFYDFGFDKTVIALHGYRAIPYNNIHAGFLTMKELGYNVLLVSQRAHYDSGGRAITFGEREQRDLLSWLDYITERRPGDKIALYGISMGCATICLSSDKLSGYPNVKLLVLESGYRVFYESLSASGDIYGKFKHVIGFFIYISGLMILRVNIKKNIMDSRLSKCEVPAFFIHGTEDKNVDPENARKNFASIASRQKDMILVEGAGHAEAFIADRKNIQERLGDFMLKVGA
ncbi:MAG: hypothetical protein J6112_05355 [Clostridia bacterium]|nr:hypothetical protein [Clostridia bacterium]